MMREMKPHFGPQSSWSILATEQLLLKTQTRIMTFDEKFDLTPSFGLALAILPLITLVSIRFLLQRLLAVVSVGSLRASD